VISACLETLRSWDTNVRPGTLLNAGDAIAQLADRPDVHQGGVAWGAIDRIQADYQAFQARHRLDQLVVINVASTEPPFELRGVHNDLGALRTALAQPTDVPVLPASSLYAIAAIDLGIPYVNFTPSLGATFPAALALAQERKTVLAGQDGKTGETLLKSVLAPMFAHRNLRLLSWVGHNIFGNRDGQVLNDPRNKESKLRTKDQVVSSILGYKPQTLVSIEYVESLDDWKTAWDHVHFQGFLGTKMIMQFLWQGCDSLLAAPLVIDLARLMLFAQQRGEIGVLTHLACFFKNPMGVSEHDFFKQWHMLTEYVAQRQGR
jgi:myo-inositol-1-phosphate synthase